jgi:hypothetical protein
MAATLTDIRQGLAGNLATLKTSGLLDNVSPYVTGNFTPPLVWVKPDPGDLIEYHQAMRDGLEHWHLVVEAYVGSGSDIGAQQKLDKLVESSGASSVKAAIEADKTLTKRMLLPNGAVVTGQAAVAQDLKVGDAHGYAEYATPDGSSSVLGCKWNVTVYMGN